MCSASSLVNRRTSRVFPRRRPWKRRRGRSAALEERYEGSQLFGRRRGAEPTLVVDGSELPEGEGLGKVARRRSQIVAAGEGVAEPRYGGRDVACRLPLLTAGGGVPTPVGHVTDLVGEHV